MIQRLNDFLNTVIQLKDGRTRFKRPVQLNIIGVVYVLSPVLMMLFLAAITGRPLKSIFARFDSAGILLVFTAPVVGLGILHVKRWGYFLMLAWLSALTVYNIDQYFNQNHIFRQYIFIQSGLIILVSLPLLTSNLRRPFFHDSIRGFRRNRRVHEEIPVEVNGFKLMTINHSLTGILIAWENCPYRINSEVEIRMQGNTLRAGIVRIDPDRVALAFRDGQGEA